LQNVCHVDAVLHYSEEPVPAVRSVRSDLGASDTEHIPAKNFDGTAIVLVVVENVYVWRRSDDEINRAASKWEATSILQIGFDPSVRIWESSDQFNERHELVLY
jgi:hypothetical protein